MSRGVLYGMFFLLVWNSGCLYPVDHRNATPGALGQVDVPIDPILLRAEVSASVDRNEVESLAGYFQRGFTARKNRGGASADYAGLSSNHRHPVDSIEGFTRIAPLLAASLTSVNDHLTDQQEQARGLLLDGWAHGSDPMSAAYWGPITDNDQLIVEASDVALSLWLLKDSVWLELPQRNRDNLVRWLLQVNHKAVPDNNWHLFVTYINVVVQSLGYPTDMQEARAHYARFREFYRGDGWFSDGPGNRFDYYNAWGIDYQLFWIDRADPDFDHRFINGALNSFANNLASLIGPNGFPIMGRSVCYRMAVTAPLILDQALEHPSVPAGEARRALRLTWSYFLRHGAVTGGNVVQGYCAADSRVVDNYSGPASCLWGLRSLIAALSLPPQSDFWIAAEKRLPVEDSDYTIRIPATGWTIHGQRPDRITIETGSSQKGVSLETENTLVSHYDRIMSTAHRTENEVAKYSQSEYRSDTPFCGCVESR